MSTAEIKLSTYSLRNNFNSPVGNMTPKMRRNSQIMSLNVILQYVLSRCSRSVDFLERSELNLPRFPSPFAVSHRWLTVFKMDARVDCFCFFCPPLPNPPILLRQPGTILIDKRFYQSGMHM